MPTKAPETNPGECGCLACPASRMGERTEPTQHRASATLGQAASQPAEVSPPWLDWGGACPRKPSQWDPDLVRFGLPSAPGFRVTEPDRVLASLDSDSSFGPTNHFEFLFGRPVKRPFVAPPFLLK